MACKDALPGGVKNAMAEGVVGQALEACCKSAAKDASHAPKTQSFTPYLLT